MRHHNIFCLFAAIFLLTGITSSAAVVGHWAMDDNVANATVIDSAGSYNGTFIDPTNPNTSYHYQTDCEEGTGSLHFDGVDDYISLPSEPAFETGTSLTVLAWIKDESGGSAGWGTVIGTGDAGWVLARNGGDGNKMLAGFWLSSGGLVTASDSADISDGQWHHVATVYDGSAVHIYVDGNHTSTPTSGGSIQSSDVYHFPVHIGKNPFAEAEYGGDARYWNGLIDDVRIYDYALSSEDIYHMQNPNHAWNPSPIDGETGVSLDSTLSWSAGDSALSHDVYFGTSESAVANAQRLLGDINGDGSVNIDDLAILAGQWLTDPGAVNPSADVAYSQFVDMEDFSLVSETWGHTASLVYKGNQTGTTYDSGMLVDDTTYYWRIDEINGSVTTTGRVWNFTTVISNVINIMPLGDSITQGYTTYDNYRYYLWDKLQSNGYSDLNFVGSHDVLAYDIYDSLTFDKDHEGHYGWRTIDILDGGGNAAGGTGDLTTWLTGLQTAGELPDVVLMHLGTNDVVHNPIGYDQNITIGKMEDIIDVLRSYNPNVTILLAKIIPHKNGSLPSVDSLNALIPSLDSYETATSEVIIVDHYTGFSTTWLADDYHPNTTGATEMSDRWYDALLPLLISPAPRVIVSTDIGGNDNDDFQSMVHYLVYADSFDTEGLISSPPYGGRATDILAVIDAYQTDYNNLNSHASYPTPQSLRNVTKQGAINASPSAGYSTATEGSNWIISCANSSDPRPLWVLVWGSITDVAQAVHDDPGIKSKIRVYSIGSWNTSQDVNARNYLYNNHSDLWWIENDSTFRGMYTGGDQSGDLGNSTFVSTHVRYHGALGDFFYSKKTDIKMGDTPSVLYMLNGDQDDPTTAHWGGMFGATGHGSYFWTDLTDPAYNENGYDGAKTVNIHRESYLRDWQTRMDWADAP